jgi:coenzyme F420 hydrogenase subunit beta
MNPALKIAGQDFSLFEESELHGELELEDREQKGQPRALRALAQIVREGLCHRCGSCVGICPTRVLGLDREEYPRVQSLEACTDCDLCVRVCPGDEFNYAQAYQVGFSSLPAMEQTHGSFKDAVVAYALDPAVREHSTSGGLVTAILLYLLRSGKIDGALVIGSDAEVLWKGKPYVARNETQILAAMKSKYAICPTNSLFSEVLEVPGRYALVGLPCQIHGLIKARLLDKRLAERIVFSIGLFCHAAIEHQAYRVIWEMLGEKVLEAKRFISRVGKHPGTPHLELKDGTLYPVYFGSRSTGYRPSSIEVINVLYRLYTPARCLTCFDASAEFADLAVGDPWMAPPDDGVDFKEGWSFGLLRSERALKVFSEIEEQQLIKSVRLTEREARECNRLMAGEKRHRAFRTIETHKRQGKAVPDYGAAQIELPRGLALIRTELHVLSHTFCFLPGLRAGVLRFMLGRGGYYLFWLNHKRRTLRVWLRDTVALALRRLRGRR